MAAPQYFFTETDSKLTSSSSRDPLGFEILWTQLGERLIPHFSTISVGATNFGVCLVLVWLVDSYLEQNRDRPFSDGEQWRHARDGLLIVAEALHAYSSLRVNGSREGILGGRKAARRLGNEGSPQISPFDSEALLVRQLAFGVYGRYRRALASMDLLDDRGHLEDSAPVEPIVRSCPELTGLRDAAHAFFDRVRDADDHRVPLDVFEGFEQMAALRRHEVRRAFAPHLVEAADLADDSEKLVAHVYRALELPYRGTSHARDVFYALADSDALSAVQRQQVLDVCRAEELLCRFEALFDSLWSGAIDYERARPIIAEIRHRRDDLTVLGRRPKTSPVARRRLDVLAQVADRESVDDFIRALVRRYHRDTIADYRNNAAWVTFEGDRVVILNNGYSPPSDPLDGPGWSRSYYLRSLASFKTEIEEVI